MSIAIDYDRLQTAINEDAEFALTSRYLDTCLQLDMDGECHDIDIHGGRVLGIRPAGSESLHAHPSTIRIRAPEPDWKRFLATVPRPFYQDLWGAQTHHGFEVTGDRTTFHAYYRAVSRLLEVLRDQTRSAGRHETDRGGGDGANPNAAEDARGAAGP